MRTQSKTKPNCLAIKLRLVLVLHLIGCKNGASFSGPIIEQSNAKQNKTIPHYFWHSVEDCSNTFGVWQFQCNYHQIWITFLIIIIQNNINNLRSCFLNAAYGFRKNYNKNYNKTSRIGVSQNHFYVPSLC